MKSIKSFFYLTCALFSAASFAHPGHDHSDPIALLVHLLWVTPLIGAGAVAFYLWSIKREAASSRNKEK